jgi:putative flavoprotein involved in K+ transport
MGEMEKVQAVIVGGGQAGLATAHELAGRGVAAAVLEASERVGDQWRRRWDSLQLFTPARFDGLPGSKFPAPPSSFPGKDQMADYLETYARDGRFRVRTGVRALKLSRRGDSYILETTGGVIEAEHVVIATGYQRPNVPGFATDLNPAIVQLSASDYRNSSQLKGEVLVVGAATSGVEIAIEAAKAGHKTVLAGRGTGAIPPFIYSFNGKFFWFYANRIASVRTPMGRRMKPLVLTHGAPLIRLKMGDAIAAGVERAPRVVSVADGNPVFDDGRQSRPDTIVWCTGFKRDYSWIEMPIVGADGYPRHVGGVAEGEPGLYFVGLPFQTRLASALIGGVGEDAALIATVIASRLRESRRPEVPAMEVATSRP